MQNYFSEFSKCYLIAEIGVNHNGDITLAKEMIDAAKQSGADGVKFQTFKAESLVSDGTPKVKYQKNTTSPEESHYDMIKSLELSTDDHYLLKEYCDSNSIQFLSTPYDIESARFLSEELNVEMFKTASADIVDLPLHEYIASTGKPSIISVGMATMGEIEKILNIYHSANHSDIILLHCVSNYPCTDSSLNLRVLETLGHAFQLPIGYSDHSIGSEAAILSIAFNAKVIEKHFTLDKNLPGPDHLASSTPEEFMVLANSVRRAEIILGSPVKNCQAEERQMASVSRKSIVLSKDCAKGTILKAKDLTLRRPGTGISSHHLESFVGSYLRHNLTAGSLLKWSDIKEKE